MRSQGSSGAWRIAYIAVFTALAMIFSYVESLIPFYFGVPGMKLGIPNICIVTMLFVSGPLDAVIVNILRIFLTGILFTNVYSMLFSFAGALLSFVLMLLIKHFSKASVITVSVFGGIAHNAGQLIIAAIVVDSYEIAYYLPALLIAGFVTGLLIGIVSRLIIPRVQKLKRVG